MKRPSWPVVVTFVALVLLSLSLSRSTTARADKSSEKEARALYAAGTKAYAAGNYKKAIMNYGRAYAVLPNPLFLYNIAQAFRLDNQPAQALSYYRQFLDKQPDAANRAEVEARISELEQQVGTRPPEPSPSPSASPVPEPSPSPSASPVASPAPSPSPTARPGLPGPDKAALTVGVGGDSSPDAPARDRSRPIYKKWWFWTAVGVVAVGATVATVLLTTPDDPTAPGTDLGNEKIFALGAW